MWPRLKDALIMVLALLGSWTALEARQTKLTLRIAEMEALKIARIVEGVPRPRPVLDVPPPYPSGLPAIAEGSVTIKVTVGKDGAVKDANIVTHARPFDDSALASVRQDRFEPVLINGTPAEVIFYRTVTFPKNRGQVVVSDRLPVIEVLSPKLIKQVDPKPLPSSAPAATGGRILVEVAISTTGQVKSAQLLHGASPQLDLAALEAIRQWIYERTAVNGLSMEVVTVVVLDVVS